MERFTNAGLTFDLADGGPPDGPAVILLHGFPEDRSSWDGVTPLLQEAGLRTLAPDQRGYSPGASPTGRHEYRLSLLAGDVLALADQAGAETFHLVGHDWGAGLGWYVAAHHADRVRTFSALSVPHPRAFTGSMLHSTQLLHSWYMAFFQLPQVPERLLAMQGGKRFSDSLQRSGLNEAAAERYAARAVQPGALTGPINWYRALPSQTREQLGDVAVPTMLVWSDKDPFITRAAVDLCAQYVKAPYRLEVLPGVSHWIPEEEPARTAELLLSHFGSV
jgi:pimeloyl-ACP methyl ester carboxylesterase